MARFTTDSPYINRDGAPTQQKQVEAWYAEHPGGSVSKCARDLGRKTDCRSSYLQNRVSKNRLLKF